MSTTAIEDIVLGAVTIAMYWLGHPAVAMWAFVFLLFNVSATYVTPVTKVLR